MDTASNAARQVTAATPKQSAMQEHAQRLHDQASRLAECNDRLGGLLNRLQGAQPPEDASAAKGQPEPIGVLYVARFGAERVGLEIDRLNSAISQLEQIA